jgi:hypothetical protein
LKTLLATAAVALALASPTMATPAAETTTGDFLVMCAANQSEAKMCSSYMVGVLDTLKSLDMGDAVCIPAVIKDRGDAVIEAMIAYNKAKPESRKEPYTRTIIAAIMKAYPCK